VKQQQQQQRSTNITVNIDGVTVATSAVIAFIVDAMQRDMMYILCWYVPVSMHCFRRTPQIQM